jgi:hypothetical protein
MLPYFHEARKPAVAFPNRQRRFESVPCYAVHRLSSSDRDDCWEIIVPDADPYWPSWRRIAVVRSSLQELLPA